MVSLSAAQKAARKVIESTYILIYLENNVSGYAVNKEIIGHGDLFKASYYKEIISEVLSKNLTNSSTFTEEFIKILKELIT